MNGMKKRREEERKWFTGVCLLKMVFFLYSLEGLFLYFISWYQSQQEN
jgi:hypothetical protein